MKIIPAIDILGGKVVRLFKGEFEDKKEFSADPLKTAQLWQERGAEYLHVVDLDGAKAGEPKNYAVIEQIAKNVSIPIEVGGGIRSIEHIEQYCSIGVERIVLGSAVMHDISFIDQEELKDTLSKIAISFDAIRGDDDVLPMMKAGTYGWKEEVPIIDYRGLIDRFITVGIHHLNYTDRLKDGTLFGLDEKDLRSLTAFLDTIKGGTLKVIYAGGIATVEDIRKLAQLKNDTLEGVIVGMALYENKFTLLEAIQAANAS